MASTGFGLLVDEHRGEIAAAWKQAVRDELGIADPALAFAVAPLLRELALTAGEEPDARRRREAWARCAVLVRSTATSAQLAREFKLLHRGLWSALRARGAPISQGDRRAADEWLDEALAEALDRLERVRARAAAFERPPPARPLSARSRPTPPPLPPQARRRPPPLPLPDEPVLELEPLP